MEAQSPVTATSKILWNQPAASLADANALTVMAYVDGAQKPPVLAGKTCTGTVSPFACTVPLPSLTAGQHTLMITVWKPGNIATGAPAIESKPSDAFIVVMAALAVAPERPINPRTAP